MSEVDTSGCLTKGQAAARLGTSTKAIERAVAAGDLVQHWRRQPGTPDVAVYFPDEVAALGVKRAAERRRGPSGGVLVPAPEGVQAFRPAHGNGNGAHELARQAVSDTLTAAVLPSSGEDLLKVLVAVAAHVVSQTSETSQTPRIYLTVREAAAFTGLRPTFLKRMIAAGTLSAIQDGRVWKVRRKDLEAL